MNKASEAKRKYNERVYKQINTQIPIEMLDKFKEKCESLGISQRQALMELIAQFLDEKR